MNKFTIAGGIVGVALVTLFGLSFVSSPAAAGEYDQFAQCIADSGATYYAAFWCPACNQQTALFGASEEHLPYVECSNPNRSLNATCAQAGIDGFPTWEFGDGSRETGVLSMSQLAERTGCTFATDAELTGEVPQEEQPEPTQPVDEVDMSGTSTPERAAEVSSAETGTTTGTAEGTTTATSS